MTGKKWTHNHKSTHPPGTTACAKSAAFTAKGDKHLVMALLALSAQKAMGQDPAAQVLFELYVHEVRERGAGVANDLGLESAPVFLDELVERGLLRFTPLKRELLGGFFDHDVCGSASRVPKWQ